MRLGNPTLRAFDQPQTWNDAFGSKPVAKPRSNTMTVGGTVTATSILLGICVAAAAGSWAAASSPSYGHLTMPFIAGGAIGGLILALIISFKPKTAPVLAPIYAAAEGLFLGAFSLVVGGMVAGATQEGTAVSMGQTLVLQAITLTFAIVFAMLGLYAFRIIRPGAVFRSVVLTAVGGAILFGLVAFVMALLGNNTLIALYSPTNGGMVSVGFSLLLVGIASLCLILDFQMIDQGVQSGAPKYLEWYGGFALLVTIVWLYVELLRLLAKLRSSD